MNDAEVVIRLDEAGRNFEPGEVLAGQYVIHSVEPGDVKAIEVSVLWYTEGKGDEDLDVHEFWRQSTDDGEYIDPHRPGRFSTKLPCTPLSYEGRIVKIRWCVRVRAFIGRREVVGEKLFQLGSVPSLQEDAEE